MSKLLKLNIEGMHCGGCVTRLSNTLRKLEGVDLRHAEVGAAELSYDDQRISSEEIAAAIERIGFQVTGTSE
ncbi:MAG: heavy-metal-associated domain-containing protein [Acidobacteriota bacterium]